MGEGRPGERKTRRREKGGRAKGGGNAVGEGRGEFVGVFWGELQITLTGFGRLEGNERRGKILCRGCQLKDFCQRICRRMCRRIYHRESIK